MADSPIARAIAELETEKSNLAARCAKVDEAIASLRSLFHLPAAAVTKPAKSAKSKPAAPAAIGPVSAAAVRAALANGPLSPGALARAVGTDRVNLRYVVRQLEEDGTIVSSGTTAARRLALAGKPAKEAP